MFKQLHKRVSRLSAPLWLILLGLIPASLSARDFEYTYEGKTLTYTVLDEEAKTVRVMQNYDYKYISGVLVIPSIVSDGTDEYTVTSIDQMAFYGCTGLTSITIPDSMTSIGGSVFMGCSGLTSVTIPNSVTSIGINAFRDCSGLTSIDIPNSVTSIDQLAFYGCTGLTSINIGNSVTSIGNSAFDGCSGLTSVTIPNSVTSIGESAFSSCTGLTSITIPNSVTSIGEGAFRYCTRLTSITIPNSVTSIDDEVFDNCTRLISVIIPNSVTSIGSYAFYGCISLTSVTIPNSVTSIGEGAFRYCTGLTSITIPNSVTSIGNEVFVHCTGLISVIIPNSVTSIGEGAFEGCTGLKKSAYPSSISNPFNNGIAIRYSAYGNYSYEDGCIWSEDKSGLYFVPYIEGEFTIPNSVTDIRDKAFEGCSGLTSITIPSSVTSIGENTFKDCTGLTSITIPNSVTSIGNSAFKGCSGLTRVTIPNSVTSIGNRAFSGCSGLTSVTLGSSVSSIEAMAFEGCSEIKTYTVENPQPPTFNTSSQSFPSYDAEVIVPEGSLTDYINSNWDKFSNLKDTKGITANKFTDDVFNYRVYDDKKVMLMPGNYSDMASVSIPERVVYNDEFQFVTAIANDAFKNCTNITTLTLPKRLDKICDGAFEGCTGLTSINFPETLTSIGRDAFYSCEGLTDLTFNNQLNSIGNYAFGSCTGLTKLVFPESLVSIGSNAFNSCSALTGVTINSDLESIGNYAFYNCKNLETFNRKGIAAVGKGAFDNCSKLDNITVDWAEIAEETFYNCGGLKTLAMTNDVTSIGNNAFYGCSRLSEVAIPASVSSIGQSAFESCSMMSKFSLEDGLGTIEIGSNALYLAPIKDMYIGRDYTYNGYGSMSSGIESLTYGNAITTIPANAFNGISGLRIINFGSSIEAIGENAFNGCALTELVLPPHVKTIGNNAFSANNIKNIAIGSEVTEIGEKVFDGANQLAGVSITATTPPMANNNTFSYYDCPLYVSPGCVDTYYNFTRCWYRFTGHDLIPAEKVTIQTESGNMANITLKPGETMKLSATMTPANASLPYIFWRSTNPAFATVDQEGNVTLVNRNEDDEIATYADGAATECKIIAETLYANCPVAEVTIKDATSGIEDIITDEDENDGITRPNDIYNLQGICLKRNASEDDIKALRPGFYIIGGKKVIVK